MLYSFSDFKLALIKSIKYSKQIGTKRILSLKEEKNIKTRVF